MICSKCNNQIPDGSVNCPYCNNPVVPVNNPVNTFSNPVQQTQPRNDNKKYIIVLFLFIIICLLSYIVLFKKSDGNNKTNVNELKGNVTRTVMIYMSPSNLEYDSGIASADLEAIDGSKVDLDNVNVLVYTGGTKRWKNSYVKNTENAIFKLTKDGFEKIETFDKLNLGDAETLYSFLDYGYKNFKTDEYDLILYNHGAATQGAIIDDFNSDMLTLDEFDQALDKSSFSEDNKLEVVLFRTCLNSTIEVASVFDDYADFLVASEEITWGSGITDVLSFLNNIKYEDNAVDFGKKFISSYDDQMDTISYYKGYELGSTYAITDLSKVGPIIDELGKFVEGIDLKSDFTKIARSRASMFQFAADASSEYDTVDLYNMVQSLSKYSDCNSDKLLSLIEEAVVYNWSNLGTNGLSVYFPYKGSLMAKKELIGVYDNIDFNSSYATFVKDFNKIKSSGSSNAFSSLLVDTDVKTESGKYEASLKLNDDQQNTYSNALYIVFAKDKTEEGKFQPIYSSDNVTLDDDGTLHTNIGNNCIIANDDKTGENVFITTIERNTGGKRVLKSYATLNNYNIEKDINNWRVESATIYYDDSGDDLKIGAVAALGSDSTPEGTILNLEDFGILDISNSSYKILDENGKYKEDWEKNSVLTLYEISLDEKTTSLNGSGILKKGSLEDVDSEYYAIFKVFDVYGNSTYSELMKLEK